MHSICRGMESLSALAFTIDGRNPQHPIAGANVVVSHISTSKALPGRLEKDLSILMGRLFAHIAMMELTT